MTKANECTCPSGDGSLRHPCPAHPAVEQTGEDERDVQGAQGERDGWGSLPIVQVPWNVFDRAVMWVEDRRRYGDDGTIVDDWKALKTIQRDALAQPSPAPTLRAAIDVANDRFEVPVAKWWTDLAGEEERPEVVAFIHERTGTIANADMVRAMEEGSVPSGYTVGLMTVAQHERIVASRWEHAMDLMGEHVARISEKLTKERDAALARVAELEKQEPVAIKSHGAWDCLDDLAALPDGTKLYAAHVAQAQHSVPEGWKLVPMDPTSQMTFVGQSLRYDAVNSIGEIYRQMLAAAPGKKVPKAWLDVQAERRRQITAEGWTPEHDDKHNGGELADAAACYALWAGGINPGNWREFWPWAPEWLKHSEPRRMLVKAGALILAEIERLDRAAERGKEVGHE